MLRWFIFKLNWSIKTNNAFDSVLLLSATVFAHRNLPLKGFSPASRRVMAAYYNFFSMCWLQISFTPGLQWWMLERMTNDRWGSPCTSWVRDQSHPKWWHLILTGAFLYVIVAAEVIINTSCCHFLLSPSSLSIPVCYFQCPLNPSSVELICFCPLPFFLSVSHRSVIPDSPQHISVDN